MSTSKRKARAESVSGLYAAIPHAVLDCLGYQGCSAHAKALLFELMRQHNGSNNGHMHLTPSWLARRGWNSRDMIQKARAELIDRSLIVQTRQGGLNHGPSLFGVTWLPITNFVGLDLQSGEYTRGAYARMNKAPLLRKVAGPPHGTAMTAERYSTVPPHGTEGALSVPSRGTETGVFGEDAVPPHGHNVSIAIPQEPVGKGGRRLLLVGGVAK